MKERYEPTSDFLKALIAEEAPLVGSRLADANLQRLVELMEDQDLSNRDWATMLLAQEELDTPSVRSALLRAARDVDGVVRAEALLGLAKRDTSLALPFAKQALSEESACMAVFEAAELIADPSLTPFLRPWTETSDNEFLDQLARDALVACEKGCR